MAEQPYPGFQDLPRIATKDVSSARPQPTVEDEYAISQGMIDFIWPVASWVIVISNTWIAVIAIANMWQNGYNPFTHGALTVIFCVTLALIAAIYKKILKGP